MTVTKPTVEVQVGMETALHLPAGVLPDGCGTVAEAGIPAVVHCGDGPLPGRYTGLGIFAEALRRHPRLIAVLAHAGMPDYLGALGLVRAFPCVHLDTALVGTAFLRAVQYDNPARPLGLAPTRPPHSSPGTPPG